MSPLESWTWVLTLSGLTVALVLLVVRRLR